MAKKRLADLLRSEVQKVPQTESESPQEAAADELPQQDENAASVGEPSDKDSNPTQAELEATVKELRAVLERERQKESALMQKIADLQANLDERNSLVQKLQQEVDKAKSIKTELETTKKTALQLAETNSQLTLELNNLKKEKAPVKVEEKKKLQPQPLARKTTSFTNQPPQQSGDFAANSWFD